MVQLSQLPDRLYFIPGGGGEGGGVSDTSKRICSQNDFM